MKTIPKRVIVTRRIIFYEKMRYKDRTEEKKIPIHTKTLTDDQQDLLSAGIIVFLARLGDVTNSEGSYK
tara:strand:- start:265 stop:471 length:207 start_codon:yes stop_codon:yes gene_type:complete